ncbi:MAG: serine protease [Gemmataceae bacterium]
MSRQYFVRDRGRVLGPFTREQLFDMRDRGQLQAYHEVSPDKLSWKAFDLLFSGSGSAAPPPVPVPGSSGRVPKGMRREQSQESNRTFVIIVVSVLGLIVITGIGIAGFLIFRSKTTSTGTDGDGGTVAAGAITFNGQSSDEQDRVLRESVGLVVTGVNATFPDGREWEVPAFFTDSREGKRVVRFGNAKDLVVARFGEAFFRVSQEQRERLLNSAPSFDLTEFGTGSGFVVSADGHFVTNQHVVRDIDNFERSEQRRAIKAEFGVTIEPRVWVFFGQKNKYVAKILHVSKEYDVAVLKIDRKCTNFFALCDTPPTDIPATLKNLSALGFPGVDREEFTEKDAADGLLRRSVNAGPIERLFMDRAFEFSNRDGSITTRPSLNRMRANQRECYVMQHSAQIYGGNSGGPLVMKDGTVLGINTWSNNNRAGVSYALTLPQLAKELGDFIPNLVWRKIPK